MKPKKGLLQKTEYLMLLTGQPFEKTNKKTEQKTDKKTEKKADKENWKEKFQSVYRQ